MERHWSRITGCPKLPTYPQNWLKLQRYNWSSNEKSEMSSPILHHQSVYEVWKSTRWQFSVSSVDIGWFTSNKQPVYWFVSLINCYHSYSLITISTLDEILPSRNHKSWRLWPHLGRLCLTSGRYLCRIWKTPTTLSMNVTV